MWQWSSIPGRVSARPACRCSRETTGSQSLCVERRCSARLRPVSMATVSSARSTVCPTQAAVRMPAPRRTGRTGTATAAGRTRASAQDRRGRTPVSSRGGVSRRRAARSRSRADRRRQPRSARLRRLHRPRRRPCSRWGTRRPPLREGMRTARHLSVLRRPRRRSREVRRPRPVRGRERLRARRPRRAP